MKAVLLPPVVVAVGFYLLLTPVSEAQPLAKGDRVRLTAPSLPGSPLVGYIQRIDGDRLMIGDSRQGRVRQVSLHEIRRLERSVHSRTHGAEGALLGAFGGGAVAYGLCSLTEGEPQEDEWDIVGCEVAVLPGVILGGLVGLFVGARTRTDEWEEVSRSVYATLYLRGGVGAGLRMRL